MEIAACDNANKASFILISEKIKSSLHFIQFQFCIEYFKLFPFFKYKREIIQYAALRRNGNKKIPLFTLKKSFARLIMQYINKTFFFIENKRNFLLL